jgi:hypothetical protein
MPVAIGTDSLASVAVVSVFDELAEDAPDRARSVGSARCSTARHAAAPRRWAFAATYGRLRRKRAAVAVDVPARLERDVEEYLVSGVALPQSGASPDPTLMLARTSTYSAFVRISHTVFALPFALVGGLLAMRTWA